MSIFWLNLGLALFNTAIGAAAGYMFGHDRGFAEAIRQVNEQEEQKEQP